MQSWIRVRSVYNVMEYDKDQNVEWKHSVFWILGDLGLQPILNLFLNINSLIQKWHCDHIRL
jgi:hypothetical protein